MNHIPRFVIVLVAILLGIISYNFFAGWYNVIPWAILALLVGCFSLMQRDAIINGALYGYFLFLTYIIIGYKGYFDKASIIKFILFAFAFSLLGSVGGIIGTLIGYFCKSKLDK